MSNWEILPEYTPWCYLCQLGDPHDVHMTDSDFYGIPTAIRPGMWRWDREDAQRRKGTVGTYDPIAVRRARLQREIHEAQLQLDALELVPSVDTYEDGTVIRALILNPGQRDPLTYVFLKVDTLDHNVTGREGVRWYHTGRIPHQSLGSKPSVFFASWGELQTWLSEPRRVVEQWTVMEPRKQDDRATSPRKTFPLDRKDD